MKKVFSVIFSLFIIISLFSGCSAPKDKTDKLSIVASCFPAYDFSKAIAGDKADVKMLLKPGSEAHDFDPTPADIIDVKNSDLFVLNGGKGEKWADRIIQSELSENHQIVKMVDCVNLMLIAKNNLLDSNAEVDEHVWTSPKNALLIAEEIYKKLCEISEDNSETFTKNWNILKDELTVLDNEIETMLKSKKDNLVVFADRFPARYFTEHYKLDVISAFPGCSSNTEADSSTVANIIETVKKKNIKAVFYTEFSNQKMADTVIESTDAEKLMFHSCHNVSKNDFKNGETYLSLMKKNVAAIDKALD